MKKHGRKSAYILVILLFVIVALTLAGCNSIGVNIELVFDTLDERENITLQVSSANAFDMPQSPIREGFIFDGWYWDKDEWKVPLTVASLSERPLENTMRVYAKWVEKRSGKLYTLTYVDGSVISESEVEYDSLILSPNMSEKEGYKFLGWFTDSEYTDEWDFEADRINDDTVLYAKWVKVYELTLDYGYDERIEQEEHIEGEEIALPESERPNYSFEGWCDSSGKIYNSLKIDRNITLFALWKRVYTLTYFDGIDTITLTQKEGETIALPSAPYKEGYSFSGWFVEGDRLEEQSVVNADMNAVAVWKEIYCTIVFQIDGVTLYERRVRYAQDMTDIPDVPSRVGYLGYWEEDSFICVKSDIIVNAVYRPNRYRLIFNGTVISYDYKEEVHLSAANRDGKSFSHWEITGLDISSSRERELIFNMPANEVYVEGIYLTSGKVSVTFDSAGGSAVNTQEITLGERVTKPEDPVRTDYEFLGWVIDDSGESEYWSFVRDRVYENIRLIAKWKLKDYSYTDNGYSIRIERYIGENEAAKIPEEVDGKAVEEIAGGAFSRKNGLKEIIFPVNPVLVEYESIYKCPDLERLQISFDRVLTNKNGSRAVGGQTDILTYIYGVEKFGTGVSKDGKERLKHIEIVNTPVLPKGALSGCDSLQSVIFDSNTVTIGETAFYNCKNLRRIEIPKGVTYIANNAFQGCDLLEDVIFEEGSELTEIGAYAFTGCGNIMAMMLPDSLKIIGEGAFTNCSSLERIQTGTGLESIDMYAFTRCISLVEVDLKRSILLSEIYDSAFMGCESLEEIRIPKSVVYMGYGVFEGCNMQRVYCETATIPNGWDSEWNIGVVDVILNAKMQ